MLETEGEFDSLYVANELAVLAQELAPDLILLGKQATDDDNNQVGQMLAAKLGWGQATFASRLTPDGNGILVTRETDDGEETLDLKYPCVITADLRLNEPRYVALPGIIKARSKPLERRPTSNPASQKTRTIQVESPDGRSAGRKLANAQELVTALKERGVL